MLMILDDGNLDELSFKSKKYCMSLSPVYSVRNDTYTITALVQRFILPIPIQLVKALTIYFSLNERDSVVINS